ncbi:LOW QUALITY PROTEIN: 4F2 cell-surface antigen heavy chain-like [Phyllostomus hastatus]|uniref:LOW QUALITY PROTEIN: 4F2 cell-surface antigen heavy chain-like n=1 Tax=Phyllostomus hastatus TaxID=9423 RepID=UPI001E6855B8|nr:LOW QUALITY PROTEIN: 4F2 cell-surface antigen heavy chain-like [Phyllostomus hastatus]
MSSEDLRMSPARLLNPRRRTSVPWRVLLTWRHDFRKEASASGGQENPDGNPGTRKLRDGGIYPDSVLRLASSSRVAGSAGTTGQDTKVDPEEVELNKLESETQPMNAASGAASGTEKNGPVKIKVANDETEAGTAKFTGLSKEELLKVADSPSWVRTRWALLLVFCLGMLLGVAEHRAVVMVIIVPAPPSQEPLEQSWWHKGALYRISDLQAFQGQDVGDLAGLKQHLPYLSSLKVRGLVLGPIHKNQKDDIDGTNLGQIDPTFGSKEDLDTVLQSAKKKGLRVILDLTPNYRGQQSWFLPGQSATVATKMRDALQFWLQAGVDGVQIRDVESLWGALLYLAEWHNITKNFSEDRLLIAGTESSSLEEILRLLGVSRDLLLTSSYLSASGFTGKQMEELVTQYLNATDNRWCSWSLSQAGLLASVVPAHLLRLYHLLLFTLPGTPVFSSGDEIGLKAAALPGQPATAPVMLWGGSSSANNTSGPVSSNLTVQDQDGDPDSLLSLFRRLSDLRGKERALLHGDFHVLSSGPDLFSYLRQWDQNKRFLVVLNFGDVPRAAGLGASGLPASVSLPAEAELLLSTQPGRKKGDPVELEHLSLKPHEGLLLHFPRCGLTWAPALPLCCPGPRGSGSFLSLFFKF